MESMAEADPEPPPPPLPPSPPPPPLTELILSLEQATLMAKQLPTTADPTHLLHIYSSFHQAHHHLSNFLSTPKLPEQPQLQNSVSSATGNEPMQVGDGEEDDDDDEGIAEGNSMPTIDMVEEQMRDCFIKRPKRRLSPSAVAVTEERRLHGDGFSGIEKCFDPHAEKQRALELVYQFHG